MRTTFLLLVLTFLLVPSAVLAIDCRTWERMDPGGKRATLEQMVSNAMHGSVARKTRFDRVRTERCLRASLSNMQADFDGICYEGQRRKMSALDDTFKSYAWSCVR